MIELRVSFFLRAFYLDKSNLPPNSTSKAAYIEKVSQNIMCVIRLAKHFNQRFLGPIFHCISSTKKKCNGVEDVISLD